MKQKYHGSDPKNKKSEQNEHNPMGMAGGGSSEHGF